MRTRGLVGTVRSAMSLRGGAGVVAEAKPNPEIEALLKKAEGPWSKMSVEEKRKRTFR